MAEIECPSCKTKFDGAASSAACPKCGKPAPATGGAEPLFRNILLIAAGLALIAFIILWGMPAAPSHTGPNPVVVMDTSMGTIKIELYADKAPITVENFLKYVDEKHYDNTIFHRVIADFMIQGGGIDARTKVEKRGRPPIKNESYNGLKNVRYSVAMARTNDPDSATAQFFINVKDNEFLNRGVRDANGYAVFGKVIDGYDVVDAIRYVRTVNPGTDDTPVEPVIIKSIRRVETK